MNKFIRFTAAASFILIIAGGLVTSTGSGLSVPDWPLSYGTLFPPMVGGIRFEHSHRMIAAFVGLLTFILTVWILLKERRVEIRRLALAASGLILLQGLLGGLTVLLQLPPLVSVAHACLGQAFFATIVVLAVVTSPGWSQAPRLKKVVSTSLKQFATLTTVALFGQLILGAVLRHSRWSHPLVMAHILWALVILFFIARTATMIMRQYPTDPSLTRPARTLMHLLTVQFLLGISTYLGLGRPLTATAHVAVGALLLATSAVLTVRVKSTLPLKKQTSPYVELAKPRLTGLATATSLIGFLLGSTGPVDWIKLCVTLVGTVLVGAGAGTLNQYLERESDGQMERTKNRPLPSGRIHPDSALAFGVFCSIAGLLLLTCGAHPLAGKLAAITLISYLFIYTPLKRHTALCTLVGAIPGAIPPLMGWVAARGRLGLEGWLLFSILFLWQLPHFLAIAWTYREDYAKAHFKMLPVLDPDGGSTGRQIVLYCLALLFVSLLPTFFGLTGPVYFLWALLSGGAFLGCGLKTARARSGASARRLFLASILYLPGILFMMTLDRLLL